MATNPFVRNAPSTGGNARPTPAPFVTPPRPDELKAKAGATEVAGAAAEPAPALPEVAEATTNDERPADAADDAGNDPREVGKPDPAAPLDTPSPADTDDAGTDGEADEHKALAAERTGNLVGWAGSKRRRRFTDDEVETIRNEYAARRRYVTEVGIETDGAEGWQTTTDTVRQLAAEYGVGADTVNRLVLGLSYKHAPGPIDTERRARHEQYHADKVELGEAVARSRLATRAPEPAASGAAGMVTIAVTRPGEKARVFRYPLGTEVVVGYDGPTPEPDADK